MRVSLLLALSLLCLSFPALGADHAISLDLKDGSRQDAPIIAPFMISLRKAIENNWQPASSPCSSKATVFFTVAPTGLLLNPQITASSGNADFDECAKEAVIRSSPFYAPPRIHEGILFIRATFDGSRLPIRFNQQPVMSGRNALSRPGETSAWVPDSGSGSQTVYGFQNNYQRPPFPQAQRPEPAEENDNQGGSAETSYSASPNQDVSTNSNQQSPEALTLTGNATAFKLIAPKQLASWSSSEISNYLKDLHEWLKQPLEELLR